MANYQQDSSLKKNKLLSQRDRFSDQLVKREREERESCVSISQISVNLYACSKSIYISCCLLLIQVLRREKFSDVYNEKFMDVELTIPKCLLQNTKSTRSIGNVFCTH